MIAVRMEGWKNPARYVAPLAIAAVAYAAYVIVHKAIKDEHTTTSISIVSSATSATRTTTTHKVTKAKFYVVQANDTLLKIAAKTGVPLATIEQLNPNLNPNALHLHQRLRLRQ
jgi:LysM repeat protein